MLKKLAIGAATATLGIVAFAGSASAHPNTASGKPLGGPLEFASGGEPGKGNGAMGHWRGIDCQAAANSPVIGGPLGICVLDD
mgnify:FL=1